MGNNKFIPSLTPLRGIAAVLVVFFHYHILVGPLTLPDNFIISKFYLMVDLFFVLSGFIMAHVYGENFSQSIQKTVFFSFMKARFARLYPLHLFTFIYLLAWVIYMRSKVDFSETLTIVQSIFDYNAIFGVLTLTQAWGFYMEATWNTASWSISVEWFLYLLFPFLAYFFNKTRIIAVWTFGLFALISLFAIAIYIEPWWAESMNAARELTPEQIAMRPKNTIDIITGFALLRGLCGFLFGMIGYHIYDSGRFKKILKRSFWFPLIWLILLLGWSKDVLPDPLAILLFSVLILHTAHAEGVLKKILNTKIFSYIGDISYSIYMVHIPLVLTFFIVSIIKGEEPIPQNEVDYLANWTGAMMLLLVVIVIASLTYHLIEKPARKRLKNL